MAFHVTKVYGVPHRDLLVLVGQVEGAAPVPAGAIDLSPDVRGPGWVPIHAVQHIDFGGQIRLAVVLEWRVVDGAPFMEFSDLEGLTLEVRGP